MPKYAVTYQFGQTIIINAANEDNAEDIVYEMSDQELLDDWDNIMSSFEVVNVEKI
jgi:hypothetical protein